MEIKIDDLALPANVGQPITFQGKHSLKELSGIKLDVIARGSKRIEALEKVLQQERNVAVDDPFVNRKYDAKVQLEMFSYTEGINEKKFVATLREVDLPPSFEFLELEGEQFKVLKYEEYENHDDVMRRTVFLRLTEDELVKFRSIVEASLPKHGEMSFRRIGVDENSMTLSLRSNVLWSEHEEDGKKFYKQVTHFSPVDYKSRGLGLGSRHTQEGLKHMVGVLSEQLCRLIETLRDNGALSLEQSQNLLKERWTREQIFWECLKVDDTEEDF